MIKKCLGCGIPLQQDKPQELGYTPDLKHPYCERCFKTIHYNAKIPAKINFSNAELIQKINQEKGLVIFLTDFLNLNQEGLRRNDRS